MFGRKHLDVNEPETVVKIVAVIAALTHARFASQDIPDLAGKGVFKAKADEVAQALVSALGDEKRFQTFHSAGVCPTHSGHRVAEQLKSSGHGSPHQLGIHAGSDGCP